MRRTPWEQAAARVARAAVIVWVTPIDHLVRMCIGERARARTRLEAVFLTLVVGRGDPERRDEWADDEAVVTAGRATVE